MSPNIQSQRQIVAVAALVTLSVGIIASIQKEDGLPGRGFWVGYGFAFIAMSVLVDLGIALGAGLALILMVGTILENAEPVIDWLNVMSGTDKPKPGAAATGPQAPRPGPRVGSA